FKIVLFNRILPSIPECLDFRYTFVIVANQHRYCVYFIRIRFAFTVDCNINDRRGLNCACRVLHLSIFVNCLYGVFYIFWIFFKFMIFIVAVLPSLHCSIVALSIE
uniref:Uncharacterized protein n=1 Tax=Parascaris univalens TaxID=6257 RepID=A0A915AMA9_PARUN